MVASGVRCTALGAPPAQAAVNPHGFNPPPPTAPTAPQGIEIEVKGRRVRVKGPRGVLVRDFRHLAVDMFLGKDEEGETILTVRNEGRGR